MEFTQYSIRKILEAVTNGEIRVPAFQRGFVWDVERIAFLLDSIYKGYPFGSLLFWRTKQQMATERDLGSFELPPPRDEYPLDYVLDGQQRLTSIFMVFQTELQHVDGAGSVPTLYFDMESDSDAQDSAFVGIDGEADLSRYFPMNVLFESVKYRSATEGLAPEMISVLDKLQERFKEVTIPVQVLKTEDRSIVAIVFERINRLGLALDTLQLLSAWTWSDEFDLIEKFRELKEELADFGFASVGDDADLVLSCVAGILQGEPGAEKLLELNGSQVRESFELVENGIRGAIDFLRTQLNVATLKMLPYPAMLIPLSVFFARPNGKEVVFGARVYAELKKWFWRVCFAGRYGSQTRRAVTEDIHMLGALRDIEGVVVVNSKFEVSADFFGNQAFRFGSVATKSFILLLASRQPLSFISGKVIDLDRVLQKYNRSEFHHIYPRAFLRDRAVGEGMINVLANFCFLSAAENKRIGRKTPSEYLSEIADDQTRDAVLASAFCAAQDLEHDDFYAFLTERSHRLAEYANGLVN